MLSTDNNLSSPPTFPILSLYVHLLNNYTDWLLTRLHQNIGTHVVTLNAEMSMMAQEDKALSQTIKAADLVIPDGAGVIIYMRLRGLKHQRCPGIELAASLIEQIGKGLMLCPCGTPPRPTLTPGETPGDADSSPEGACPTGYRSAYMPRKSSGENILCFFGGTPQTAERAARAWQKKFPQLSILTQDGYVSGKAETEWKETLRIKQPQIIFVGIGVPRQELWIRENLALCPNSIWIGVGGSLDIWAGNKARAPEWLRNNNLEWSYRLYQEPWRWRRMLSLPKFLWRSLLA